MSVLDFDIRDRSGPDPKGARYHWLVDNAPDIIRETQEWASSHGQDWHWHWMFHIFWRLFEEPNRWVTLRGALEDHEGGGSVEPGPVDPQPPQPRPDPQPLPSQFGRQHIIRGSFRRRMYSYWSNAWVHPDGATFVFGGNPGPSFYRIDPSGDIHELGTLSVRSGGETEGWYWDLNGRLYIADGNTFWYVNPFDGSAQEIYSAPGPLWQPHSSLDGQVHSATLKDSSWRKIATVVWYRGRLLRFDAIGELDESIVTKDGEWLVIEEKWLIPGTPEAKDHNRIIRLATQEEYVLSQWDGAVGHCDTNLDSVIGEDDEHGACVVWNLRERSRRELWRTWNMGHVSWQAGRLLSSDNESLTLVDTNSAAMQHVQSHGIHVTSDYDTQVRANLSPCGKRATYIGDDGIHVVEL